LAVVDDGAMGQVFNVAEPVAFTEAEWVHRIGDVVGWRGKVVTVSGGRIPVTYQVEHSLDTDTGRLRRMLGYHEPVGPTEALERTIAWERANPAGPSQAIGILDYDAEDALLAEMGDSLG
jgi:nucleoside-diphosphate-sugar epimerase